MKILYILKQDTDQTLPRLIEAQKRANDVTVIDLAEVNDYGALVDRIAETDKVISW